MLKKLSEQDTPYVVENVEGAPLRHNLKLCGTLFPSLRVLRHRLFVTSFHVEQPELDCYNHPRVYDLRKAKENPSEWDEWTDYVSVYGGNHASIASCKDAMNIDWMTREGLSQSIPPDYTQYLCLHSAINFVIMLL
jgi:DNA (cytosine-5)-methyltransferase 1